MVTVRRPDLVVVLVAVAAFVELTIRNLGLPGIAAAVVLVVSLWLRRRHPWAAVVGGLAGFATVAAVTVLADRPTIELVTGLTFVLAPYALGRWTSERPMLLALPPSLACIAVVGWIDRVRPGDLMGGAAFLGAAAGVGAALRYRAAAEESARQKVRLAERELLARELHDTVAHHVSAIATQAQAGLAVAPTSESAPHLRLIDEEAARALSQMRTLVSALRSSESGVLPVLSDLTRLATPASAAGFEGPTVEVQLADDLPPLSGPTEATVVRIAQEAVTNALRHARSASRVAVSVTVRPSTIEVLVDDDGREPARRSGGFGLLGMAERVQLLGGTLTAGPRETGGWRVHATLPREGVRR